MMRSIKLSAWLLGWGLILTQLSGCGFEVKDTSSIIGFDRVYLVSSRSTHQGVVNSLTTQFKGAGVDLTRKTPQIEVRLSSTAYDVSTLSRSVGGLSVEQLKLTQSFEVLESQSGKKIMSGEQVAVRDRRIDASRLTVGQSELYRLQRAMRVELGQRIFQAIQRHLSLQSSLPK